MNIVAFLKARAGELSSILAASGATAVGAAYITGQLTAKQALVGIAAAVVGYVWPETKPQLAAVKALTAAAMIGGALSLSACTAAQLQNADTTVQAVVAAAPVIVNKTACAAQALANDATDTALALGDAEAAAGAKAVSIANGLLCLTTAQPVPAAKS